MQKFDWKKYSTLGAWRLEHGEYRSEIYGQLGIAYLRHADDNRLLLQLRWKLRAGRPTPPENEVRCAAYLKRRVERWIKEHS